MVYILCIVLKKVFLGGNNDFRKSVSTILKMLAAGFGKGNHTHKIPINWKPQKKNKKKKQRQKTFTHKKVKCINKIKSS